MKFRLLETWVDPRDFVDSSDEEIWDILAGGDIIRPYVLFENLCKEDGWKKVGDEYQASIYPILSPEEKSSIDKWVADYRCDNVSDAIQEDQDGYWLYEEFIENYPEASDIYNPSTLCDYFSKKYDKQIRRYQYDLENTPTTDEVHRELESEYWNSVF